MSTIIKYRIHELAKDFGVPSKIIGDVLAKYGTVPKNHMQILTDDELNYIFDHLTQQTQTEDINAALMEQLKRVEPKASKPAAEPVPAKAAEPVPAKDAEPVPAKAAEPAPAKAAEPVPAKAAPAKPVTPARPSGPARAQDRPAPQRAAAPAAGRQQGSTSAGQQQRPGGAVAAQSAGRPAASRQSRFENAAPTAARPPKRDPKRTPPRRTPSGQVLLPNAAADNDAPAVAVVSEAPKSAQKQRHVDTRGASVNLERYDESIDSLVPDRAQQLNQTSKQKLTKRNNDRRGVGSKRRNEEQEKLRRIQLEILKSKPIKVLIPNEISVGELATRLKKTASDVIKQLMKLGVMASISQFIDYDTAALAAIELGAEVEREVIVTIEDRLIDRTEDTEEQLVARSPVVVVMGHVDHGKTSLLDHIRRENVAAGEAGGITQHIGAYRVSLGDRDITFIDTPGHAAFTEMRARGAQVTDIVILIVAADDGIMPQTVEAINHAKAAKVPIIVAINKIDRENAQPERILQQLTEYDLVPEEWGGETIVCKISALKGIGIDNLLEMVLLTADMQDLKANPDRPASGTVIEARLDRGRGPVATVLIQNGTLHTGDIIIAGKSVGHVRIMTSDRGERIETAEPSVPVEIIGLGEVPEAGDEFFAVADERMARELVSQRRAEEKEAQAKVVQRVSLDSLFSFIKEGEMKNLNIIVKADVRGTCEAVAASLEKLTNEEVRVSVIHSAVGAINESDIMLAGASNAIIVGFNVRPSAEVADSAKRQNVDIRLYRVIYECLEEMEAAMKGLLAPKFRESVLGQVEVRQIFRASNIGTIAGCYVLSGKIVRSCKIRLVRDGVVVHEGELASLKRFKDDAREVAAGYECGCSLARYTDIKVGDIIEPFIMEEVSR